MGFVIYIFRELERYYVLLLLVNFLHIYVYDGRIVPVEVAFTPQVIKSFKKYLRIFLGITDLI